MAVKIHLTACGVIKTTPNNHPSQVGYDTETHKHDTKTVDLENSYWNNMEARVRNSALFYLLSTSKFSGVDPDL